VSVVEYKSRKRELQIRLMNEGRCNERLKTRVEESTSLTYTGLHDKTKLEIPKDKDEVNKQDITNAIEGDDPGCVYFQLD
jgi:hypothetical protein